MSEVKEEKKLETKTVEEELVLGDEELGEISTRVKTAILPDLQKTVAEGQKQVMDDYLAKTEEVTKKNIKEVETKKEQEKIESDPIAKGVADGTIDKEVAEMTSAKRFYLGMRALTGDYVDKTTLKKINAYNIASQLKARKGLKKQDEVAKTGYANETTAADGSVLIPDAEFVLTVFENLPNYGVAFADADVRQTDRTVVRVISLDSGLSFYATAEAGVKTGAKVAFAKNEATLQKYAVIVAATDELTDDAAIDYWNVVTREITRAYARLADEIVFTNTTSGITNISGVLTENVSGAGTTIKWDDLLDSQAKTEDDLDESNFKWYMRKETWFRLLQTKGVTNDHYLYGSLADGWIPNPNQPMTPWGTPIRFTRVLPTSNSVSANDAFAVYGDLKNYLLYNRRGMQLTMLTEGIVKDSDGSDFNLATQDARAMRAVVRLLGILPKGNRTKFVVLGTGTVS